METTRSVMIVAGEPSGDRHAAKLVEEIRNCDPDTRWDFFGAAGPMMRDVGVEPVVAADELSIVGVAEIGRALPMFLSAFRKLVDSAAERDPQVVILVDFPEFNLKLAKSLKKRGFTVVYYISPQLWAWRRYRIRTIRRHVDLLLTILPFEKAWYAERGVDHVEYIGNPLATEVHPKLDRSEFCLKHSLDPARPIIALLPGSRRKEIVRVLPVLIAAAAKLFIDDNRRQFVIPIAHERHRADVEEILDNAVIKLALRPDTFRVVADETYDALHAADAAAVTSGTATLETGIIGTPMVIVYATSGLNYVLLRPLISVEHYGLINLIAGRKVAKELIQGGLSADNVAAELSRLLDPSENAKTRDELRAAAERLGSGGASRRAAEAVLRLVNSNDA
ncbi:MAG: lipid-A-disaccharide synthase [Pyrinomonadaceae bacterium]|nr:lipid-A-disaccharide synthase [Pyrinomonadaceae bacterium]